MKTVYKCEWRDVVALNFDIEPRLLQPLIPRGTRLLPYHEHTLITMMAKNVREFRPWGGRLTLFRSVEEIDLRTYLSWETGGQRRLGHFKLKNLVSSEMATYVFRWLTGQRQTRVPITRQTTNFETARIDAIPTARYSWTIDDEESHFMVTARNEAGKSEAGSKEMFVLWQEHRFVRTRRGTWCYPIRQAPWMVWNASSGSFDVKTHQLASKEFRKYFRSPRFVLLSRGGEVTVSKGWKVQ
jgi:uncharacterized protein YqjF (DUF2071 family)